MFFNKKNLILAICIFIVSFKVMAANIYIQSAIERACLYSQGCTNVEFKAHALSANEVATEEEPVYTLFLMSHVTGNVGNTSLEIPIPPDFRSAYIPSEDMFILGDIADCPYKPPKS
jgi:hypothetical protein